MTSPFTIYIGNEIVADMHIRPAQDVKLYEPVPAEYHLGGAHVFNAGSLATQISQLGLNGQVSILGTVSTDVIGEHFMANCDRMGINTNHVVRVDDPTLVAIVTHGESNNSFYFPNAATNAITATTVEHLPDIEPEDHKMLLMQGVCSSMKPSGPAWLWYVKCAFPQDLVIYDVNARPSLIKDVEAHRTLVDQWAKVSSVIKISDADIEALYPDQDIEDVAGRFLNLGAGLVVETRGHKSVRVMSAHGLQEFPIPNLTGIENTVGAGDNFMAGLTLAFAQAGVFTKSVLKEVDADEIAGFVQTGITSARDHLLRQNPAGTVAP